MGLKVKVTFRTMSITSFVTLQTAVLTKSLSNFTHYMLMNKGGGVLVLYHRVTNQDQL